MCIDVCKLVNNAIEYYRKTSDCDNNGHDTVSGYDIIDPLISCAKADGAIEFIANLINNNDDDNPITHRSLKGFADRFKKQITFTYNDETFTLVNDYVIDYANMVLRKEMKWLFGLPEDIITERYNELIRRYKSGEMDYEYYIEG